MSQKTFSNTEVPAGKTADPYTASNKTEPELKEKVQDLVSFIESCKFGMMTTRIGSTGLLASRCMALAAKEGGGVDLLFHTNTESGKTDDLKSDPKINVAFLNPTGEWASVSGEADIVTDRETVRKYYSPALKAWLGDLEDGKHDGGPEDPRIGVIKVKAVTATYALATGTSLGRGADIIKGAITGSTPKVNKLRELTEQELDQLHRHANSHTMAFSNFGNLVQQGFNFTSSIISVDVLTKLPSSDQLTGQAMLMAERIKHPAVIKYIVSPGVIFSTVTLGMAKLGFGFAGIKAGGTAAAAIQASFYGGAVPAGGFFAVMQSMGALGTLNPVGMAVGAGLAGSAAFLGWAYGGSS